MSSRQPLSEAALAGQTKGQLGSGLCTWPRAGDGGKGGLALDAAVLTRASWVSLPSRA